MNYYGCRYTLRANAQREDVLWEPDQFHVSTPVHLKSRARVAFSHYFQFFGRHIKEASRRSELGILKTNLGCNLASRENRGCANLFANQIVQMIITLTGKPVVRLDIPPPKMGSTTASEKNRGDMTSHPNQFDGTKAHIPRFSPV